MGTIADAQPPGGTQHNDPIQVKTGRLHLRAFRDGDRSWFVALHADPEVMRDYGGALSAEESEAKLGRYIGSARCGSTGRFAVETAAGEPLGYTGVMPGPPEHPLGSHLQIGWRFFRHAWGQGFAIEAAAASLALHFARLPEREVLAYTARDNVRSQSVMARLQLRREAAKDFRETDPRLGLWQGLVWVADPTAAPRWT